MNRFTSRVLVLAALESLETWSLELTSQGFAVERADAAGQARTALASRGFDAVVLDLERLGDPKPWLRESIAGVQPRPQVALVCPCHDNDLALRLYGHCDIMLAKPFGTRVLVRAVRRLLKTAPRREVDCVTCFAARWSLSPRESEVLRAALQGLRNKEIAARMDCKPATVVTYWARIAEKTACRSRAELLSALLECAERRCRFGGGRSASWPNVVVPEGAMSRP